jgi:hypothetical protein
MPVHKAGTKKDEPCYQWGNQKVYCGQGAKGKAAKQGQAAYANGYKGKKK